MIKQTKVTANTALVKNAKVVKRELAENKIVPATMSLKTNQLTCKIMKHKCLIIFFCPRQRIAKDAFDQDLVVLPPTPILSTTVLSIVALRWYIG